MSFTKVTCEASGGVWVPDAEVCTNKPQGQTGNQQQTGNGTKFGQTYFGGLLSGILGNLSLGFGQGAGQSLNPQQPQVIQQPARDNTILIVIIAVVVVGIVILMNRRPIEK
jgi:hypothetical protein